MRRGLIRGAAWAGATAAAVSVSWFGVHRVLRDASFEQPRALVVAVPSVSAPPPALPTSIGSAVATSSAAPSPRPARRSEAPPSAPPSSSPSGSGQIRSYTPQGGRIVVNMGATSATLVSATPDAGWSMHYWTGPQWLRVDFQQGATDTIFYVTWNGHAPMVQTGTG
ncbi:hypothetical protein [Streptacidiphilus sp. EB129]|uniref:hypothetical protein n=1 Tax=Streptacidiphilus sp. EB129 TaxID=3156262 RepID=UPI003512749B